MPNDSLPQRRTCATMEMHHQLLDTSQPYVEARDRIEDRAFRIEHDDQPVERQGVTRIPVVVHVVWNDPADNVSDEQIDSQLAVINADFRMRTPDLAAVPEPFAAVVADARIEFARADTDPTGAPTDGVVRVQTARTDFAGDDAVKSDATGGSSAWPSESYLTVWVCRLSGGLLGYA